MVVISFQIPVISNALGGILVGLVTSYAGGVRKVTSGEFGGNIFLAPDACQYIIFALNKTLGVLNLVYMVAGF